MATVTLGPWQKLGCARLSSCENTYRAYQELLLIVSRRLICNSKAAPVFITMALLAVINVSMRLRRKCYASAV